MKRAKEGAYVFGRDGQGNDGFRHISDGRPHAGGCGCVSVMCGRWLDYVVDASDSDAAVCRRCRKSATRTRRCLECGSVAMVIPSDLPGVARKCTDSRCGAVTRDEFAKLGGGRTDGVTS